jgi:hypothetical protein
VRAFLLKGPRPWTETVFLPALSSPWTGLAKAIAIGPFSRGAIADTGLRRVGQIANHEHRPFPPLVSLRTIETHQTKPPAPQNGSYTWRFSTRISLDAVEVIAYSSLA